MYAVIDRDADGIADDVITVVSNLPAPLGLAYANGSLWVATTPTIYRFDNVDELALSGRVSIYICTEPFQLLIAVLLQPVTYVM